MAPIKKPKKSARRSKKPSRPTTEIAALEKRLNLLREDHWFAHGLLQDQLKTGSQSFTLLMAVWGFLAWGLLTGKSNLPETLANFHKFYIAITIIAFEAAVLGYIEITRFSAAAASEAIGDKEPAVSPIRTVTICGLVSASALSFFSTEVFFWCLFEKPASALVLAAIVDVITVLGSLL